MNHLTTLRCLVDLMGASKDPWWIITSAATALHTLDWSDVRDIDVMVSRRDARMLLASAPFMDRTDGGTEKFRSSLYATLDLPGLPIDIFADFEICRHGHWSRVLPATRLSLEIEAGLVYTASIREQLAITKALDRAKDASRIAKLQALINAE